MNRLVAATRRISLGLVDVAFATLLAVDLVLEAALAGGVPDGRRLVTALLAVPFAAPIAFRRRAPGIALVSCMGVAALQQALHGQLFTTLPSESAEFVPILCAYGAGAWLEWRRAVAPIAVASALLLAVSVIAAVQHAPGAGGVGGDFATILFFILAPWVLGCFVRERGRRAAAFSALEAQALAERVERERAAIAQERIVIGLELQDIIAHNVSVMVIQAGGARRALMREPEAARASILNIERSGREALAEMRRLLGLLRKDDDPRALSPQPGLEQLPELSGSLAASGLRCMLRHEGDPIALTPGIDLVGYRVLETGLHSARERGCSAATVTVRFTSRALELEVDGDRGGASIGGALAAVAERVELYGGELETDASAGEPFVIRCRLPLERARVAA